MVISLRDRIDRLETQVERLKTRLHAEDARWASAKRAAEPHRPPPESAPEPTRAARPEPEPPPPPPRPEAEPSEPEPAEREPAARSRRTGTHLPPPPEPEPFRPPDWWPKVERQLVENWTGILGAVVLVTGITFVGGYTGLRMSPLVRSLMVAGAGGALGLVAFLVDRSERWRAFAQWVRSAGAAVFLLACFGSSAIPGLTWIDSLAPALALLLVGIAVNLFVAYRAGREPFAALHVVLSLIPLILVPQSNVTLLVATVVSVAGLAMAWRHTWDLHALLTLLTYAAFHVVWVGEYLETMPTLLTRLAGGSAAVLVSAIVTATHYRRTRTSHVVSTLPLVLHITNWGLFAGAIAAYANNQIVRGGILIAAAVVVFFLATRARAMGLRWVYLTDTLVAETLATVGVIALRPLAYHWLMVPAAVFALTTLYHRLGVEAEEKVLEKIGAYLVHAAGLVLLYSGVVAIPDAAFGTQNAVLLLAAVTLGTAYHGFMVRTRGEDADSLRTLYGRTEEDDLAAISLLGVGVGLLAVVALAHLHGTRGMTGVGVAAGLGLLWRSRKIGSRSLALGAWIALAALHVMAWQMLLALHPMPVVDQLVFHFAPLVVAGTAAVWILDDERFDEVLKQGGVYALGITVGIAAFTLLDSASELAPGVAWLGLSLAALHVANRIGSLARPALVVAFGYLAVFLLAFATVVSSSDVALGPLRVRWAVEAFWLAVLGHWWAYRPSETLRSLPAWQRIHPLMLEFTVAATALVNMAEIPDVWRPVSWIVLAGVCAAGSLRAGVGARLGAYGLALFWASTLTVVTRTSGLFVESGPPVTDPAVTGSLAIFGQVLFIVWASRRLALAELEFPAGLDSLAAFFEAVEERRAGWLYYPFFISVALFLYGRFDSALLTLLWAAEAFLVFGLSLALREAHFRYMALAALAAVLARLVVFDLSQSNLGVRGVVFTGVGLLMLGMNSLYNRFKDRYE